MKVLSIKSAAVCLAACYSLSANASVITFDDVPLDHIANFGPDFGVLSNYDGLNWVNTIVFNQSFSPGSQKLNVSPPNVATDANFNTFNLAAAPIEFNSAMPFTFSTAYFVADTQSNLTVTVNGLRDGVIVDTKSFQVGDTAPVLGQFNWSGIDTVVMSGSGGADPSQHQSLSIDNVVVSPVPLPAAAWLLLSGLGAFAAGTRRRKAV
jgi:hypothetical protein